MASRYELIHHPQAANDFAEAEAFFAEIDPDLADLFRADFRTALQGIAGGRPAGHLYLAGHSIRWIKLKRFSHKVFFGLVDERRRFVLALISGKRHPRRIQITLSRAAKVDSLATLNCATAPLIVPGCRTPHGMARCAYTRPNRAKSRHWRPGRVCGTILA